MPAINMPEEILKVHLACTAWDTITDTLQYNKLY